MFYPYKQFDTFITLCLLEHEHTAHDRSSMIYTRNITAQLLHGAMYVIHLHEHFKALKNVLHFLFLGMVLGSKKESHARR